MEDRNSSQDIDRIDGAQSSIEEAWLNNNYDNCLRNFSNENNYDEDVEKEYVK